LKVVQIHSTRLITPAEYFSTKLRDINLDLLLYQIRCFDLSSYSIDGPCHETNTNLLGPFVSYEEYKFREYGPKRVNFTENGYLPSGLGHPRHFR
jgi:hypothetical protein